MDFEISPISIENLKGEYEFLQSSFWGVFKGKFGFTPLAFEFFLKGELFTVLVLVKELKFKKKFAYIPRGPLKEALYKTDNAIEFLYSLITKIKEKIEDKLIFIRIEPPLLKTDISGIGPFKKGEPVQVEDTIIVDLSKGVEEIYKNMHQKTRYNINLSKKKGVVIKEDNSRVEDFYKIYLETAQRDNISIHSFQYYKEVINVAEAHGIKVSLLFAEHEGDTLASILVFYLAKRATYLYGASSNNKRNLMASYRLQDFAITKAIELGCTEYDMFGIPPDNNLKNKMNGLYRFKTGFSLNKISYIGSLDYCIKGFEYFLFRLFERINKFYHKKIKVRRK